MIPFQQCMFRPSKIRGRHLLGNARDWIYFITQRVSWENSNFLLVYLNDLTQFPGGTWEIREKEVSVKEGVMIVVSLETAALVLNFSIDIKCSCKSSFMDTVKLVRDQPSFLSRGSEHLLRMLPHHGQTSRLASSWKQA